MSYIFFYFQHYNSGINAIWLVIIPDLVTSQDIKFETSILKNYNSFTKCVPQFFMKEWGYFSDVMLSSLLHSHSIDDVLFYKFYASPFISSYFLSIMYTFYTILLISIAIESAIAIYSNYNFIRIFCLSSFTIWQRGSVWSKFLFSYRIC